MPSKPIVTMCARVTFRLMMRKIFFAFIGGLAMGITSAPLEAWYLAWVAVIPLWLIVVNPTNNQVSLKSGSLWNRIKRFGDRHQLKLACAVAWGLGYQGLTLFWITGIHPMDWMGVPWFWSICIATICWLIITFWGICIPLSWAVGMLIFQDLTQGKSTGLFLRLQRVLFGTALWRVADFCLSQSDLFWHFLLFLLLFSLLELLDLHLIDFSDFFLIIACSNTGNSST